MSGVIIIGAGLFGAVARDLLRARGIPCVVVDDQRPLRGSFPAGCLMKPSWLSGLGKDREGAMALLDELYGLKKIPMRVGDSFLKFDTITHVSPSQILKDPDIVGKVVSVNPQIGEVLFEDGTYLNADVVLVAAGVWCAELLPEHFSGVKLEGLQGASLRARGEMPEARLAIWAPYKQSVGFEIEPGTIWFGDGTALKPSSWKDHHTVRVVDHARDVGIAAHQIDEVRFGLRPYVRGKTGWFERAGSRCWVSTGGAKNGVALAASQALKFFAAIK
ncbi:putative membrane protein [Stenotrophomonas phage Sonora]|nr:putative membrane protein [Stenotrophomonas phage Sonora]